MSGDYLESESLANPEPVSHHDFNTHCIKVIWVVVDIMQCYKKIRPQLSALVKLKNEQVEVKFNISQPHKKKKRKTYFTTCMIQPEILVNILELQSWCFPSLVGLA